MTHKLKTISHTSIAATAVFTALVTVATAMLSVYVPATRGYFNIGETMVYTTALLFGPYIGAFAGGVGSMLADLILGYPLYAPATLLIKASEGAVVGILGRMFMKPRPEGRWRAYTTLLGVAIAVLIAYIGVTKYTGAVEASFGLPAPGYTTLQLQIPSYFWTALAGLAGALVIAVGVLQEPKLGGLILSTLLGGAVMVTGYFIYEWILFGPAAFVEVPVNLGQAVIGLIVAIPLVKAVWARIPQLKR
ncbi:MAG: ECF transporter S component [Candidatus Bathyarchaeia archaeon]